MKAEMKEEYNIISHVRSLPDPEFEASELKSQMLIKIFNLQSIMVLGSLFPTLICLFVKISKNGMRDSEHI